MAKTQENKKTSTHLVIPDPHAHPDFDNKRFTALGNLILDLQPDVIICLGDLADMPSLCSYEKGTGKFEGRRYQKDIAANIDANKKLWAPLESYNAKKRANKDKQYKPRKVLLYGNHEDRINRTINQEPILAGTIGLQDLQNEKYWDEVYPFLQPVEIDGVFYSHYFTSGVMGRPISSEHTAYQMLMKQYASCTAGHIHTRDYCERVAVNGKRMQGLVAGCFIDYHADFAGNANNLWWKGVVVKREVQDGNYDIEFVSLESIMKRYSDE